MNDQEPSPESLREECARLGLEADDGQMRKLGLYLSMLAAWNRTTNLVGAKTWQGMLALAADSFHLAAFLEERLPEGEPLALDLGAGAGLPGIPLRLLWTQGRYLLIEPRRKRAAFMRNALARLRLAHTQVVEGRVQDLDPGLGPADLVLARAFLPWPEFLDLAGQLVAKNGRALVMAGEPAPEAASGWRVEAVREYAVEGKNRYFWLVTPDSISM